MCIPSSMFEHAHTSILKKAQRGRNVSTRTRALANLNCIAIDPPKDTEKTSRTTKQSGPAQN